MTNGLTLTAGLVRSVRVGKRYGRRILLQHEVGEGTAAGVLCCCRGILRLRPG